MDGGRAMMRRRCVIAGVGVVLAGPAAAEPLPELLPIWAIGEGQPVLYALE
jgi:hypothetical protein